MFMLSAPVDGIYLTNTNESQYYVRKSLSYNEMEHGTLRCVTVGGYPPPEIKVNIQRTNTSKKY